MLVNTLPILKCRFQPSFSPINILNILHAYNYMQIISRILLLSWNEYFTFVKGNEWKES